MLPFISNEEKNITKVTLEITLDFLTKVTSLSWCNMFPGVTHTAPDTNARWLQLTPPVELKSVSHPWEQMASPPPCCYLLPLTKQMEGEKASQVTVGAWASFPLSRARAQAVQHNATLGLPSLVQVPTVLTETIHALSSSTEKLILCNPPVDHPVYFSQSN